MPSLPLPGATVEVTESGYLIVRWQGYVALAPLNEGEYAVFTALEEVRINVAAAEQRSSERTRAARGIILASRRGNKARAAGAGGGAGTE